MSIFGRPDRPAQQWRTIAVNILGDATPTDVRLDDAGSFSRTIDNPKRWTFLCPATQGAFNLHIWAPGMKVYHRVVTVPSGGVDMFVGAWPNPLNAHQVMVPALERDRPQPVARGPLPPITFPGQYVTTLPWTPPQTRDYLRADAWGVTIQGAPFVPGLDPRQTNRLLTWIIDRYTPEWQDRWIEQYAKDGYTHWALSADDFLGPTDNGSDKAPGSGKSLGDLLLLVKKIKQTIPYVTMFLASKDFSPHNMTVESYQARFEPILDALLAAGVDEVVPGWEWDLLMPSQPGRTTIDIFKWVGQKAHAAGASCWLHFSTEKTSWFQDQEPRGRYGFYDDLGSDVDGLLYQADGNWSLEETQARIVDSLHQFGTQGNRHKFRFFESLAMRMFASDTPTEDDANLWGYLACCTVDNVHHTDARVWGAGCGLRMPDGSVI